MKGRTFFGGVTLLALLFVYAGISQAGGYMHKSKGHEKSMRHQMGTSYSEFETREYGDAGVPAEFWGPIEAGTLPGSNESSGLQDTGVDPSRWEEPTAE